MDPAAASQDEDGRAAVARSHSEEDMERTMSSFEEGSSEGSAASASRDPHVLPCKQMAWHSLFPAYSDAARVGQPRAYDPIMERCELACADYSGSLASSCLTLPLNQP